VDDSERRIGGNIPRCDNAMIEHFASHRLRRKRLGFVKGTVKPKDTVNITGDSMSKSLMNYCKFPLHLLEL
jgi:hypothetical protein